MKKLMLACLREANEIEEDLKSRIALGGGG